MSTTVISLCEDSRVERELHTEQIEEREEKEEREGKAPF